MSKNVTFMLYGFILGLMLLTILSNLGDLTRLVIVLLLAALFVWIERFAPKNKQP